jgi:exopolysaccharide production protein ExoZ
MVTQPKPRRFPLVQALRAVAAASVALTHILYNALAMAPGAVIVRQLYRAMPWSAGVDIFFVISGFVIVHASRSLFTTPGAAKLFLQRRLTRVVPLYWLMTSLFLIETMISPDAINGALGGAVFIAKSYLFIPCARPGGVVQPVLGLGWTLNYELFFYVIFTPFLRLRQAQAVTGATLLLAAFVLAAPHGLLHGVILQTWSNPIILEFCAGMLLALLPSSFTLHAIPRLAIVAAVLVLLHLQPGWSRLAACGIPAAVLLFAAVTGKASARLPRIEIGLVMLGDASYALYLVHPFVMRAMALLWQHLHRPGGIYAYILACLVLAQLTAIVIHYWFEIPVTRQLRAVLEERQVSPA